MDSRSRRFPRGLAELIEIRDQVCRTPYCEPAIRHTDHVVPVASGGETSFENGQGLCEACNHAKESPGWERNVVGSEEPDGTRGDIVTVTPTGHEYFSPPPTLPGSAPQRVHQQTMQHREDAPDHREVAPQHRESVPDHREEAPHHWESLHAAPHAS